MSSFCRWSASRDADTPKDSFVFDVSHQSYVHKLLTGREQQFETVVAERTGGRGVDVVVDIIGAKYFERNLAALAKDGRLVIIGTMGGNVVEQFNLGRVQAKRLSIMGSTIA